MQEEILRTIRKLVEMGWIKKNEHLTEEALAGAFVEVLKEMPLNKFVKIFSPFD